MAELKKIMITPYFGQLPEWFHLYRPPDGYRWLLDMDYQGFMQRVKEKLGIDYLGSFGSGKVWDFRCALGLLYEQEIKGFEYWGHTDFDCVYGDTQKWVSDEYLAELDVHSNHHSYVNGCWSLYRNVNEVNNLFKLGPWKEKMENYDVTGWVEKEYSRVLEGSGLKYDYTFWQGWPYTSAPKITKTANRLYQDGEEIMMFHFRRSKKWPL